MHDHVLNDRAIIRISDDVQSRIVFGWKNSGFMADTVELASIAVRIADATRLTGIGETKLFELIATGKLDTANIGRRRFIL